MENFERGLAAIAQDRYDEGRALLELASAAGCGAATFELAQAYDWLYYSTYWTGVHRYPRSHGLDLFWLAARSQGFLPARAYLLTHEWSGLCEHSYEVTFDGEGSFERDWTADEYMRMRLACYSKQGRTRHHANLDNCLTLFRLCVARNLPVPGDLGDLMMSNRYRWGAEVVAQLNAQAHQQALRGMPWAQSWMGHSIQPERQEYWCARAARNGRFMQAWERRRESIDMFEHALYLDWFASINRRVAAAVPGLMTVDHMRRRTIDQRHTQPLTPVEVYCFGRAAHRLLVDDGETPGKEPIRKGFEFWHRLGASYRACLERFTARVLAFYHVLVQRRIPRDVARLIVRQFMWPWRAQSFTHEAGYHLSLRKRTKRICYKE